MLSPFFLQVTSEPESIGIVAVLLGGCGIFWRQHQTDVGRYEALLREVMAIMEEERREREYLRRAFEAHQRAVGK